MQGSGVEHDERLSDERDVVTAVNPEIGFIAYKALTNQLYRDFLGRDADRQGLRTWSEKLSTGEINTAGVAVILQHTDEALGATVDQLYRDALDREPDPSGRAHWVRQVQHGMTLGEVACTILGSDDCWLSHRGRTEHWVAAAYRGLLHREVDPDGLAKWVQLLVVSSWSRPEVAEALHHSPEFSLNAVERAHQRVLGRAADPDDVTAALLVLRDHGEFAMAASLTDSREYFERALRLSLPRSLVRRLEASARGGARSRDPLE